MAPPVVCPVCESALEPHCPEDKHWCSWARCSNKRCGYIGKPEENKWIPPMRAVGDNDRR